MKSCLRTPAISRILFTLLLCLAILPPLYIQSQYLGKLSSHGLHHWLIASTMKYVDNWLEDGIVADQMLMLEWPHSIENPTLADRKLYTSYLPGAVLKIYLLKLIFPQYETLVVIQFFNILDQFFISLSLMAIIWLSLARYRHLRNWLALMGFVTYQMLPQTTYIHSMVYFADIAVLLPILIVLFLELLLRGDNNVTAWPKFFLYLHQEKTAWLKLLQTIFLTWAVICDWLAVFLLFVLLVLRFLKPLQNNKAYVKDSVQLVLLPIIVVVLFFLQLYHVNELPHLKARFMLRSSLGESRLILIDYLIRDFFIAQLGFLNSILLFLVSIFVLLQFIISIPRKQPNAFLFILSIFMITCYLHLIAFPDHAMVHANFSITKFFLLIALLFSYVSYLCLTKLFALQGRNKILMSGGFIIMFLFAWQNFLLFVPINSSTTFIYNPHVSHQQVAEWLRSHAKFDEVYLGKSLSIADKPPYTMALARKAVHSFASKKELKAFINKLPSNVKYFVILSQTELNQCRLSNANYRSRIYDQNDYWLIMPFNEQTLDLPNCLTEDYPSK